MVTYSFKITHQIINTKIFIHGIPKKSYIIIAPPSGKDWITQVNI